MLKGKSRELRVLLVGPEPHVVAELGAGKSVLLKGDMGDTVDRNGRVVAIDRTEAKEYAVFAQSLRPDTTTIVDLMTPEYSLDPLRVFGPLVGARMVQSLFAVMLGIIGFVVEVCR